MTWFTLPIFATGKIGVIDGRTGSITHEVSTGAEGGANDVLVTPEGEVYAVSETSLPIT